MSPKKPRRISLLVLICIVMLAISIAVSGIISFINYDRYMEAVLQIEADEVENIGRIISCMIEPSEWRELAEAADDYTYDLISDEELEEVLESEAYTFAAGKLQQIVDSFALQNACVFNVDQYMIEELADMDESTFSPECEDTGFLTFLLDCYMTGCEDPVYEFGQFDSWWDDYEEYVFYRDYFLDIINTGESSTITETLNDGTVVITGYYPMYDGDDCTTIMSVSRCKNDIKSFVDSFFIQTLVFGIGVALVLCGIAILLFWYRIVRPVRLVTHEAENFISNNTAVSDKLSTVNTHDEIQTLAQSFLRMEQDIRSYIGEVERVTIEKEHIRTELSVAAHIQEDMLPRVFPPYPNRDEFTIFASMDPAKEVGGDFYDFFFIDDDNLALVIADVSGKGVPASLFMVIAKTLIKTRSLMGGTPAQILHDVNLQLCDGNEAEMFVTVWLTILNIRTGKAVSANAGHEHPVLCRKGGDYELVINRHSPAVATLETIRFREHEFELFPGDRLFVYSDGLPEATNAHDELYGNERMLAILNKCKDKPLSELLPSITEDVEKFVGEAPQFDDLTMLAFEYHGPHDAQ